MILLILLIVSAKGHLALQTIPFSSEKHCEKAASILEKTSNEDKKVTAVCVYHGLKP